MDIRELLKDRFAETDCVRTHGMTRKEMDALAAKQAEISRKGKAKLAQVKLGQRVQVTMLGENYKHNRYIVSGTVVHIESRYIEFKVDTLKLNGEPVDNMDIGFDYFFIGKDFEIDPYEDSMAAHPTANGTWYVTFKVDDTWQTL